MDRDQAAPPAQGDPGEPPAGAVRESVRDLLGPAPAPGQAGDPASSGPRPEGAAPTVPDPPRTGDPAVDAVLAEVAAASTEPLEVQLAAYERAHRTLQDRLADVEG